MTYSQLKRLQAQAQALRFWLAVSVILNTALITYLLTM